MHGHQLSRTATSLKVRLKEINRGVEAYCVEVRLVSMQPPVDSTCGKEFQAILTEFSDLIKEAKELPPSRRCGHAIVNKEGASIPNIRPYRYPRHQKEAIEAFVDDMLAFGLMRPSVSCYAK